MSARPDDTHALVEALAGSQRLGLLGRAPLPEVIAHSEAFVDALAPVTGTVVDLGSGGGVPGLVIAWRRPDLHLVLVDRRASRADHLERLVRRLDLRARVEVLAVDAAELPQLLEQPVSAVVARGFGPPESVVAAAVPILTEGGLLIVSEPPAEASDHRWPDGLVERSGLQRVPSDRRVAVFRLVPRGT